MPRPHVAYAAATPSAAAAVTGTCRPRLPGLDSARSRPCRDQPRPRPRRSPSMPTTITSAVRSRRRTGNPDCVPRRDPASHVCDHKRARSRAALRSAGEGIGLSGTSRTTSRPKRVRTTSSPASANFINSVSCHLAWLTEVRMTGPLDQLMVQVKNMARSV
jgi:hypothetical protein